jgi:hypothetical protein
LGKRPLRRRLAKRARLTKKISDMTSELKDGAYTPNFSLAGEKENSVIHLEVPWYVEKEGPAAPGSDLKSLRGGSHVVIATDEVVAGGSKMGPDIVIDDRNLKMTVGPGEHSAPFQQIVMRLKGVTLQTVASVTETDSTQFAAGSRKSLLSPASWTTCAKIEVKNREMALTVHGPTGSEKPTSITLKKSGLTIDGGKLINIVSTKLIKIEGKEIHIKAPNATVGKAPVTAT